MGAVSGWNFDWDDNIFYMPTDIVVYRKGSVEEKRVSTAAFATVRQQLGKPGDWEEYEVRTPGSFRFFRDSPEGRNYFREDIDRAIGSNRPDWIGPSWEPFLFALSRPNTARNVTIITARGHSPKAMQDGLRFLQERGYFRNLPEVENLFPVSHPSLAGSADNPSATKAKVMQEILDKLSAIPVGDDDPTVLDRDGTGGARLHLWGFSDDDWGNFEAARDTLSAGVKDGRWSNTKITVFYTGIHDPEHEPCRLVIKSDGSLREQQPQEANEGTLTTMGVSTVSAHEAAAVKAGRPAHRAALWEKDLFELI